LRTWDVPGCAVVVVQRDRTIFLRGYGSRSLRGDSTVGPDTIFPIASCTKSFTATALAILVSEGKVGWDDRVSAHLPDFHLADPHVDALVSVRDLMCHRTGVASHDFLWYRSPLSQDELIRRIQLLPVTGQFRSSFAYQNLMVMAAGKIVGQHHPMGWAGFVSERILKPLGMTQTFTSEPPEKAVTATLAIGHRKNIDGAIDTCDPYPQPTPNPAGSIYLSARDLGRWLQFQLGDGTWRGRRLVSTESLAETHRPQSIIPPGDVTRLLSPESVQLTYGMGWVISDYRGVRLISHAGLVDGFRCHFTLLPDHGLGIGILANLHGTRFNLALSNRLTDLLLGLDERDWHGHYQAIEEADRRAELKVQRERQKQRAKAKPRSLALCDYAGDYSHPAYGRMTVRCEGQRLVWEWSSFQRELIPLSGDTFELPDIGLRNHDLQFVIQAGKASKLRVFDVEFDRCP
ncbi:MAG: serine hydrolase, partial [Gemmataceae bacterium]|nr:serine hydrolase [Gemmataceae bacterium]